MGANLCSFVFLQNFDKFEGADFKYGNNHFQSLTQKYPNKTLSVRNLGIFVFSEKFGNLTNLSALFSNMTIRFESSPKKY